MNFGAFVKIYFSQSGKSTPGGENNRSSA